MSLPGVNSSRASDPDTTITVSDESNSLRACRNSAFARPLARRTKMLPVCSEMLLQRFDGVVGHWVLRLGHGPAIPEESLCRMGTTCRERPGTPRGEFLQDGLV